MSKLSSALSFVQENRRVVSAVLCVCLLLMLFMSSTPVFAAEDENTNTETGTSAIENAVNEGAQKIYNLMRAIVIPIIIVLIAWAGLQFAIGGAKGTESAMKIFKGCCFSVIFVVFAPIIANEIGNWFKDSGGGDLSNYNPLT